MVWMTPPSGLPAISPSSGEIGRPQGFRQSPKLLISPLEGEMAGRPEGGEQPVRRNQGVYA